VYKKIKKEESKNEPQKEEETESISPTLLEEATTET
jgi:hypothetical protein